MALLELRAVDSFYGYIQALRDVSLDVDAGEIVALIGSNGAGKTTTLRTISGLMHPSSGTVTFDGQDISQMPPYRVVSLGMCQAPEGRRLFPRMTVNENLLMGAYTRSRKDRESLKDEVDRVFDLFPRLRERSEQIAGTLSGGEQQMLAIGRALMARPRILLLDEPSLGLAPLVVAAVFRTIVEINSQGTPILLVEQNAHKALGIAHRAYVLETGSIVREGSGQELLDSPDVQRAYLGT
jgi:branched-chain amino acid transport system ATP-binding protein